MCQSVIIEVVRYHFRIAIGRHNATKVFVPYPAPQDGCEKPAVPRARGCIFEATNS